MKYFKPLLIEILWLILPIFTHFCCFLKFFFFHLTLNLIAASCLVCLCLQINWIHSFRWKWPWIQQIIRILPSDTVDWTPLLVKQSQKINLNVFYICVPLCFYMDVNYLLSFWKELFSNIPGKPYPVCVCVCGSLKDWAKDSGRVNVIDTVEMALSQIQGHMAR